MSSEKCWICGAKAETREHLVKATDVKSVFPGISKKNPVYIDFRKGGSKKTVYSARSHALTYKQKICSECNNNLSQPYDKAWEQMSSYLANIRPSRNCNVTIAISNVFPDKPKVSMRNVHLYFCKMFGCMVGEYSIHVDVSDVAQCLRTGVAYNKITLLFIGNKGLVKNKTALMTPVTAVLVNNYVTQAFWLYNVNHFSVVVAFSALGGYLPGFRYGWHPDSIGKKVTIQAINTWRI